ncbi:CotS family spore coat protein [Paenibacillus sp. CAU 1782]
MEPYIIKPWDDMLEEENSGLNLEQYVPPELEKLAHEVCRAYDMSVSSMTLITSKPDKGGAIWRIDTNRGPRSLKVLHRTPQRSLFSVHAQQYVLSNGGRVPGIILTKDGANSVVAGGKLWIVTDWIEELTPVAKIDLEGAMTLCHGLGEFHHWSKGYEPPPEAGNSSRIFKWESQYEKILTKIGWFRHIAQLYRDTAASDKLLNVLDMFEGQAKEMLERFRASAYRRMVAKGEAHWGLAHQDYGWSNGQMGPGGIWVIDLDGVAYDLAIRDLRKIITSTMDDMGSWDLNWIRGVIGAYHKANPLDQETFELLWIDMAFPNEFYKHVKEVVFRPVEFMDTELGAILDRVLATEANKWEVLKELEKDKSQYAAGDYSAEQDVARGPYAYRNYAKGGKAVLPQEKPAKEKETEKVRNVIRLVVNPDGRAVLLPGPGENDSVQKGKRKKRKERKEDKSSKKNSRRGVSKPTQAEQRTNEAERKAKDNKTRKEKRNRVEDKKATGKKAKKGVNPGKRSKETAATISPAAKAAPSKRQQAKRAAERSKKKRGVSRKGPLLNQKKGLYTKAFIRSTLSAEVTEAGSHLLAEEGVF